ncbi:MAG: N-acetyltransferase family protein [Bauldia sp.]
MTSITIRRLGPDDATFLDRIAAEVFDEPVRPGRVAAYLREPNHMMVVAIDGDLVVGQCAGVVHRHPDKMTELYIDEVGVAPTHHRRGIARRMMEELFAWGREQGCEEAWVGTEVDNAPARSLYRGFGPKEEDTFVMYVIDVPGA